MNEHYVGDNQIKMKLPAFKKNATDVLQVPVCGCANSVRAPLSTTSQWQLSSSTPASDVRDAFVIVVI